MYKIEDFYHILMEIKTIPLSFEISNIFDEIQDNISSQLSPLNTGFVSKGNPDKSNHFQWERNKTGYKSNGYGGGGRHEKIHYSHSKRSGSGGNSVGGNASYKKDIPVEDWESLRNFKTTKIEEPVKGIDKDLTEIRIALNKISVNNYAIQREIIVQKIYELQKQLSSPKTPIFVSQFNALDWEDEEDGDVEIQKENKEDVNLIPIGNAIFEIASSNKFFSELYAELYAELSKIFPIFNTIASDFLVKYMESLPKIRYVDPNVDYDGFCTYTKENDVKKATSTFIINLMKKGVLPLASVIDIILRLYEILVEYIHIDGKLNEVEELAENWAILITNSKDTILSEDDIWNSKIVPNLRTLSQMKPKELPSLSNRVIFKWMNILDSL
jgi:hypothetical protein